jgi:hypothetical protein
MNSYVCISIYSAVVVVVVVMTRYDSDVALVLVLVVFGFLSWSSMTVYL